MLDGTLHKKTVQDLRAICRENRIRIPAGSLKKQIVELIEQYESRKKTQNEPSVQNTNEAGSQEMSDPALPEEKNDITDSLKPPLQSKPVYSRMHEKTAFGILEIQPEGYGYLRRKNFLPGPNDIYVSASYIRRFLLRNGDMIEGRTRPQREGDRFEGLSFILSVNEGAPGKLFSRPRFEALTPVFPTKRIRLETPDEKNDISLRLIDLIAPVGKGQRGLIVSPPKAGKTYLIKSIARAIEKNHPEIHLMVLLIDERPEEVTDIRRSVQGEVIYSTFDEESENHLKVSEMTLERAQRLVEAGKDVFILLDSITRLARAYNLVIPPTGRSLTGGLDPGALYRPKRFFGSARAIENGGSLTILATALVETGSRMDDIIFEEFKGTGNMEVHLDRKLSEKRVFPAIDLSKSGTRREEELYSKEEYDCALSIRRMLASNVESNSFHQLISLMEKTHDNQEFIAKMKGWVAAWQKEGYHFGG